MAVYDLEEQEQIENLKAWWKQHGTLIAWVVAGLAVLILAWQGWSWYQNRQAAEAGALFAALQQAVSKGEAQKARTLAGELTEKYAGTAYAPMGALMAARQSFDAGDTKTARTQLAWVVSHAKGELRDIARLRLAAVLLDEQAYDEALKELANAPLPAFAAAYAELKGDVLVAQGKSGEARAAYQAALDAMGKADAPAPGLTLLRQKLEALGETA